MGESFGKTRTGDDLRFPRYADQIAFTEQIAEGRRPAEERALRVEAMKVAAMMDPGTRVSWTRLKENAELVYQWLSGGERGVDEAPGRYVAEHVLDAERRTGTTSAYRVVGEE